MLIKSLREALIRHLLKKRIKMAANGSNCSDIDKKLEYFGHKS